MKVTGPSLRRRNHAWLQMRSPERRAARLARRQELDDSSDDADSSSDESADSGEESDDESGAEPTKTVAPPLVSASVGVQAGRGVVLLPTAGAKLAAGASQLAAGDGEVESDGLESDGEESDDESTSASATATPTSSATEREIITLTPLPHSSTTTGLDGLITSLTQPLPAGQSTSAVTSVVSATNGPSLSVPATEAAQSGDPGSRPPPNRRPPPDAHAHEREGSDFAVAPSSRNTLTSGAIAGIVIGVLAFVAILVGAALLWRKRRRDRGLPFFPEKRFRLRDDDDGSDAPSIAGPLPGKVGGQDHVKTNSQIMDELMRAAYSADNGTNDMEGAFAPVKKPQQQQQQASAFMDEKAYVALAGPPIPPPPPAAVSVPVSQWLSEVKTPTQPNGPEIPPTPQMPPSATLPRPGLPHLAGGGRVPEPPRPAYFGRDTMTTETTNTTARWYG